MKQELINKLEALVKQNDPEAVKEEVFALEEEFREALAGREKELKEEFVQNGGEPAAFAMPEEEEKENSRFKELVNIYDEKLAKFESERKNVEQKNLDEKKQVIEDLKKLIAEEDRIGTAFQTFNELREKWRNIGKVPGRNYKQVQSEYSHQIDLFFYTITIYKDLKELDFKKNLEQKQELIKSMQTLLEEPSIKKMEDHVRAYQEEWDNAGPVPQEQWEHVRDEFRKATSEVYKKIQAHYDQLKTEQKKNLEAKTAILHKLQTTNSNELKTHKSWKQKTEQVLEMQKEWKQIGFASREANEKLWHQFRSECDVFFNKKQEFYEQLKSERSENKAKKEHLIEKAETLQDSTNWKETTDQFINLQKEWTSTGSAARSEEQALWKRFRAACDHFFNAKKEYFGNIDEIHEENKKQKEALITKIESYELSENNKDNLNQLKEFVKDWNEIGHVPKKDITAINNSFKAALDKKYDSLKLDKEEKNAIQYKNKIDRLLQSNDSDQLLRKERRFIQDNIHKLESTIQQYEHNLHFFNTSKGAAPLVKEVEEKINRSKVEVENLKKRLKLLENA